MKTQDTITKISKWGNGYGIRVPIGTLETYKLIEGSEVVLIQEADGVKISPRKPSLANMSLAEIMVGVTPERLAVDKIDEFFGDPQGNEIW